MAVEYSLIDTFQTRFYQSFVNLTKINSTTFPAVTTIRIDQPEFNSSAPALTSISVYDQWALRVVNKDGLPAY